MSRQIYDCLLRIWRWADMSPRRCADMSPRQIIKNICIILIYFRQMLWFVLYAVHMNGIIYLPYDYAGPSSDNILAKVIKLDYCKPTTVRCYRCLLLSMFTFLSWGWTWWKPCFTRMAITPLVMVQFSKFNLVLKLDSKSYKCLHAINVCEFAKNAKFVKFDRTRTFVNLQQHYSYVLLLVAMTKVNPCKLCCLFFI